MSARTIMEALAAQPEDALAIRGLRCAPLSFAGLREQMERTLSALRALGVGRRDRVAVVMQNGPEMATACLSIASGAVCVPLNPEYKQEELATFLPALGAQVLLVQAGMASPARDEARRLGLPVVELHARIEGEAGRFTLDADEAGGRLRDAPAAPAAPHADDVALVLHTSGTTARPKVVPLTQANLMASAANLCASISLTAADRVLDMMPLFHVGGFLDLLLAPLSIGATSICTASFSAPGFVACVEELDPTVYQGVPTMLQEILAEGDRAAAAVRGSSLRLVRSVSAPLPPVVREEFESRCGVPVVEIYGMTETSGLIASEPLAPRARKEGSVGVAAGTEIAVLDASGAPLAPGARGEVAVRGPNVMTGYEAPPELAAALRAETFAGSWMRTGDEGHLDADGHLFLTGRIKEIINRGGEKISPREVDELLAGHPAVADAAAFAAPHESLGEDVAVAVVRRPGAELTSRDVEDFLRPRLAYFKVPRSVHFVPEIPRTPGGKLQRARLADQVEALAEPGPSSPGAESPARSETYGSVIARTLAQMWAGVLGVETVGPDDDFFDLGGDSLKAATFVNELQRRWQEIVYVSALFDAPTVSEFEDYLQASCPQLLVKMLGGRLQSDDAEPASRLDPEGLREFRAGIVPLASPQDPARPARRNSRAVFILGTPRSGSTLLRALLGASAGLFAPPELFLLPFDDLAARRAWLERSQPFLGEGNLRAWMQLTGASLEDAERELRACEEQALATPDWYRRLQERAGGAMLVEKTPFNAAHEQTLRHAETWFDRPLYIHLARHPYGMIRSFEEAKLPELWWPRLFAPGSAGPAAGPPPPAMPPREFAETIWVLLHQNILGFLDGVPAERQRRIRFEDLVASPRSTLQGLCSFLGVDFEPGMLDPHASPQERMTDGLRPESRMIGDMKFHQHRGIDASGADQWKQAYQSDFLSGLGWELAASLGYDQTLAEASDREEFEI